MRSSALGAASALGVAIVAFLARLIPVLNGGGLRGYGNYDDGVYFAAGLGLASGRLPYRDFLILHPPGIAIMLAPFGWLAQLSSDPTAFAVARIVWMALGSVNATLVLSALWASGRLGAVAGGLAYAVFYPAVYSEHSTMLEGPQNLVLLIAIVIITRCRTVVERGWRRHVPWLTAGLVLGLSPSLKIWGVLPVVAVAVWVGIVRGRVALLRLLVGVAVSMLVVLGPFFVTAPVQMWRQVVSAQLGRSPSRSPPITRLTSLTGVKVFQSADPTLATSPTWTALLTSICVGWLIVLLLAAWRAEGHFFVALHALLVAFLLIEPAWFMHYAAFVAPSAALCLGSAVITLRRWTCGRSRLARLRPALGALFLLGIIACGVPLMLPSGALGRTYPSAELKPGLQTRGCITSDDPSNLIWTNVLSRSLRRGCRLVVDLQGYGNVQPINGHQVARIDNPEFQTTSLAYLESGSRAVISRLGLKAFTPATIRTLRSWPVRHRAGKIVVRTPPGIR